MKIYALLFTFSFFSCSTKELNKDEKLKRDRLELIDELKIMVENDQFGRMILDTFKVNKEKFSKVEYKRKVDSLWKKQLKIDSKNVKRLIEITKIYGFPNVERTNSNVSAWVIFQHTPKEYVNQVSELLEEEVQAKRFSTIEYEMVKWHLGGRKSIPNLEQFEIETNDLIK